MTSNYKHYLKSDESKYKGKYIVYIKGKLFKAGKDLLKIIKDAKKKYPSEIPLITKPLAGESYVLNDHF